MKYLGVSYYPECWGIERIATDIKLMKDANVNIVRLGEFAWSKMEKTEGKYDFELFRRAVEMFGENGINVMMCTPTAAPPAWVSHRYPETLQVGVHGEKAFHGIRQQSCYGSETYRRLCCNVVNAMTRALAPYSNIIAWQIDNEVGQRLFGPCYCESCAKGFQTYLQQRYCDLDTLNREWGNEFWSMDYSDWEEITPGFEDNHFSSSRVLESRRFYEKIVNEYIIAQLRIIKRNIPGALVTTNNPSPNFNAFLIFKELDFCAADLYWNQHDTSAYAMGLNKYRSAKGKKFFVAETGLGYNGMDLVEPRQARLNMWRAFAYGAESYLIFRWRPPLGGHERVLSCPLTHGGQPRGMYRTMQSMFSEVESLKSELKDIKLPAPEAAIISDHDVHKFYMGFRGPKVKYRELVSALFKQLHLSNVQTLFIEPGASFDSFKLLVLPAQTIIREEFSRRIKDYVAAGGTVLAVGEFNNCAENGAYTLGQWPEYLTDVFGIKLHSGALVKIKDDDDLPKISGTLNEKSIDLNAERECWINDIDALEGSETLLRFTSSIYQDQAAFTRNRYGKGNAFYLAVSGAGEQLLSEVMQTIASCAQLKNPYSCPEGVEVIDCESAVFFINQTADNVEFKCDIDGPALTGSFNAQSKIMKIDAWDMCIVSTRT